MWTIGTEGPPFQQLTSPKAVREILDRFGFRPRHRFGQNFLVDRNILSKIVAAADIKSGDWVFEIGPGLGTLTAALIDAGAAVTAVEIDRDLCTIWSALWGERLGSRAHLVSGDALKIDWEALWRAAPPTLATAKAVANLPYYVAAPLILRILSGEVPFERAVILVQREVAERMAAPPATPAYGAFSVAVQCRAKVEVLFRVPANVFFPRPEVESAVVRLWPVSKTRSDREAAALAAVVRAAFNQRRKTLQNALLGSGAWPAAKIETALATSGIDGRRRGESLALAEFERLAALLGPPA